MLRLRDGQGTLWDEFLPPEVRVLSEELTAIDALLDDDRFLTPFSQRLMSRVGRPTIPMETYLRLMYLKHRYTLGYETLVKEVADSLSWRCFCRIRLDERVPHSTTLIKLTKRCGPELIEDLNETLLRTAVERKVLRSRRLRVDTTATEADVRYPTDFGLCAHVVSRLGRAVTRARPPAWPPGPGSATVAGRLARSFARFRTL
jgi:transposase, IS5 family